MVRICQLVDGMPLGLELAAAWLNLLEPAEIAQEIARSLDFLSNNTRNLPPRHQSLRAVFESSWAQLSPAEQGMLADLAIFPAGFSREAAREVANASLQDLSTFISKSLVTRARAENGRFVLHELIRQYAEEKLQADRQRQFATHTRHMNTFARYVAAQEVALKGQDQIGGLDAIETEAENIRLAWTWAALQADFRAVQQICRVMALYFWMRPRSAEAQRLLDFTLQALEGQAKAPQETATLGELYAMDAGIAASLRNFPRSWASLERACVIFEQDWQRAPLFTLSNLGNLFIWPHIDYSTARVWLERAIAAQIPSAVHHQSLEAASRLWLERVLHTAQAEQDPWGLAQALRSLANLEHQQRNYDLSLQYFTESRLLSQRIGDLKGEENALQMLGEVAYTAGYYPSAERHYREALPLAERVGDREDVSYIQIRLADLVALQGRYAEAETLARQGVQEAEFWGNLQLATYGTMALGDLALWQGQLAAATPHYDAAERLLFNAREPRHRSVLGWLKLARSHHQRLQGDLEGALALAQEAPDLLPHNIWGQAASQYAQGETLLDQGELALAHQHFCQSLELAEEARSIMLLMRHLVGAARWMLHTSTPEPAQATLRLVIQHHATWHETRVRAQGLLEASLGAGQAAPPPYSLVQALAAFRALGCPRP
ncbi:MAG: tetratricopeptide repeat protein [Anaerolineae bacterium]|nr:tetratricopeptide repeat protein [Anaerolineae bacterium]